MSWTCINTSASDFNGPSKRAAHVSASLGKYLVIFGGWGGDAPLNDTYFFDMENKKWYQTECIHGLAPSPRNNHAGDSIGSRLYIHGGHTGEKWLGDLHYLETCFNSDHSADVSFSESNKIKIAWIQVSYNQSKLPCMRACHSLVYRANNNHLILFGGFNGVVCFNDVWIFELKNKMWNEIYCKNPPVPKNAHCASILGSKMYIFGGHTDQVLLNEMNVLDLDTYEWNQIQVKGSIPNNVRGHSMVALDDNHLFIFGGNNGSNRINTSYIFECANNVYRSFIGKGDIPSSRQRHSSSIYYCMEKCTIETFIFGGFDGIEWHNDLYCVTFNGSKNEAQENVPKKVVETIPQPQKGTENHIYEDNITKNIQNGHISSIYEAKNPNYGMHSHYQYDQLMMNSSGNNINSNFSQKQPVNNNNSFTSGAMYNYVTGVMHGQQNVPVTNNPPPGMMHTQNQPMMHVQKPQVLQNMSSPTGIHTQPHNILNAKQAANQKELLEQRSMEEKQKLEDESKNFVIQNYSKMLQDPLFADVILSVDEHEILCHRCILSAQSVHFNTLFSNPQYNAQPGHIIHIKLSGGSLISYQSLVHFLYTGTVNKFGNVKEIGELLTLAKQFECNNLMLLCEKELLKKIDHNNCWVIFKIADKASANTLRKETVDYIIENLSSVVETEGFQLMHDSAELLMEITRIMGDRQKNISPGANVNHQSPTNFAPNNMNIVNNNLNQSQYDQFGRVMNPIFSQKMYESDIPTNQLFK